MNVRTLFALALVPSLPSVVSCPSGAAAPGEGWFYLFRPAGDGGTWQTAVGAEPGRDAVLAGF